ncbi:MAG: hypothetical protein ACKO2G_05270 [Verrucomicrobiales bacterium]
MKLAPAVRIHKGTVAALFVFLPYLVVAAKLTFFNKGCMDGFGHLIIGSTVIILLGGPLTVLAAILSMVELRSFFPTLTAKDKAFYLCSHAMALLAMVLAIWVAFGLSHEGDPFDFRELLAKDRPVPNYPPEIGPIDNPESN